LPFGIFVADEDDRREFPVSGVSPPRVTLKASGDEAGEDMVDSTHGCFEKEGRRGSKHGFGRTVLNLLARPGYGETENVTDPCPRSLYTKKIMLPTPTRMGLVDIMQQLNILFNRFSILHYNWIPFVLISAHKNDAHNFFGALRNFEAFASSAAFFLASNSSLFNVSPLPL
jgi:hypothetical protein